MSRPLMSIVEGMTKPLRFTLYSQSSTQSTPQPFDLTGYTVHIVLKDRDGAYIKDTTDGITVTGTTAGQLEYRPSSSSGDLFVSSATPYRVRFRVTDALTQKEYFPNDEEDLIEVNPL